MFSFIPFTRWREGRQNPQGMRLQKSKTRLQGLTGCAVHTRQYTQVACLPVHTYIVTYQASSSSKNKQQKKKPLEVPDSGVHQARCPESIPPRHPPDSCTHVQKRRHTKTPTNTLTRTKTTLCCLARVRARPGAPACYFGGSQSPQIQSRLAGAVPRLSPPPPPTTGCPPRKGDSKPGWPRASLELGG